MDDTSGTVIRERVITVNMLVALNMERWRRAAGMTQEQLGEELGGWTKRAVSAAERSWDGKKVRQFDADLIANLASIYGIPIPALFLPPPDDGTRTRYLIDGPDPVPMEEFFGFLDLEPDPGDDRPVMTEYQKALAAAFGRYAEGQDRADVAEAVADMAGTAQLEAALAGAQENAGRLAGLYGVIDGLRRDNAMLLQALERALRGRQ